MAIVGSRGQFVIDKPLRDQLGIQPGWQTRQSVEGYRLIVEFLPPVHRESLRGYLQPHIRTGTMPATDEDIELAVDTGFAEEWSRTDAGF